MDPCQLTQMRKIPARFVSKSFTKMSTYCFALLGLTEIRVPVRQRFQDKGVHVGHQAPLHQGTPLGVRKALKVMQLQRKWGDWQKPNKEIRLITKKKMPNVWRLDVTEGGYLVVVAKIVQEGVRTFPWTQNTKTHDSLCLVVPSINRDLLMYRYTTS